MAEIIDVQFNIDQLKAQLAELDKSFNGSKNAAKQLGDEIQDALDASAKSASDARQNISRLSTTIKEQENLTAEWKDEVKKLEAEYKKLGGDATAAGQKVGAEIKRTKEAIDDNISAVRKLKLEQTRNREVITSQQKVTKELQNLKKELDKVAKQSTKTEAVFKKLGARIIAAFAAERIVRFGQEAIRVADRARGVTEAFEQMSEVNLSQLRASTKGLVSDIDLMTASVQADKLGVPVERLGELFQFAQIRARETGQDVNFLVQSIVNGLGRKSTLILDNLGITATQLKDALGGVAVQSATTAQLTNALADSLQGELKAGMDQSISSTQRLQVIQDNLTLKIGQALLPAFDETTDILYAISTALGIVGDNYNEAFDPQVIQDANKLMAEFIVQSSDFGAELLRQQGLTQSQIDAQIGGMRRLAENTFLANATTEELTAKVAELTAEYRLQGNESPDFLERIRAKLQEINEETTGAQIGIVAAYKERIKLADEEIQAAGSQSGINEAIEKRKRLEIELNAILNQRKNIEGFENDAVDAPLEEDVNFGNDPFGNQFVSEQQRVTEQAAAIWDQYYEELLMQRAEDLAKSNENARAKAEFEAQMRQQEFQSAVMFASQINATMMSILGENAVSQKASAIFTALINAFAAVNNILATVPGPQAVPLSILVGIQAIAQVRKIQSTPVPSFFEGTSYLKRNGAPLGKDTIPVMAHEGEAIIPTKVNASYPGLTDSLIKGNFDRYVTVNHVMPALKAQKQALQLESAALTAQALKGTLIASLNDDRMVRQLKQGNMLTVEMINALNRSNRKKNPYRA